LERRRKMKKLFAIALGILIIGAALAPLQAQDAKTPKLRNEIVHLKYLYAGQVERLIRPYMSREGNVAADARGDKLMVISDFPEFVDKILAVIKEIDVKPADIVITAQLVVGSSTPGEKSDDALQNDPVIKELKGFLPYKSFAAVDANLIRTINGERAQMTLGKRAEFMLDIRPSYSTDGQAEYIQLDLRLALLKTLFGDDERTPQLIPAGTKDNQSQILISTALSLKSGEKTVTGVSKLDGGDKGLILILSAKAVK
jgi:hypothetical protein